MNDFISYVLLFGSWHFSSLPVLHVIFHLLRSVQDDQQQQWGFCYICYDGPLTA
ncbi:hypothetical protein V6Z12_D11G390800 [Gossypium hirsutum]